MIALDLDDAVLHGAARAAFFLERAAQRLELRTRQRHAVNGTNPLAAAMRGFLPDADGGWLTGRFHALSSSLTQRSRRAAISVSSSTVRSPSRRISSGATR